MRSVVLLERSRSRLLSSLQAGLALSLKLSACRLDCSGDSSFTFRRSSLGALSKLFCGGLGAVGLRQLGQSTLDLASDSVLVDRCLSSRNGLSSSRELGLKSADRLSVRGDFGVVALLQRLCA